MPLFCTYCPFSEPFCSYLGIKEGQQDPISKEKEYNDKVNHIFKT
jgi:hypothetical protein